MKRIGYVLVAATFVGVAVSASAASLPTSAGGSLGTGSAGVSACGSTATATISYTQSGGNVTHVAVGALPVSCNGGQLTLTLTQQGAVRATGPAQTIVGGTVTVPLSSNPSASSVTDARILIVGP